MFVERGEKRCVSMPPANARRNQITSPWPQRPCSRSRDSGLSGTYDKSSTYFMNINGLCVYLRNKKSVLFWGECGKGLRANRALSTVLFM